MRPENFVDPITFIKQLNKEKIKFILVGRQALVQYGAPLQSFDYDFYIGPDLHTLKKLWKVVKHFGMFSSSSTKAEVRHAGIFFS